MPNEGKKESRLTSTNKTKSDMEQLGSAGQAFYDELQKETTRGGIILGAAWLDYRLGELIANFMIDDRDVWNNLINPDNPAATLLGSLGAKIEISYALGLISKTERDNLRKIKWIRNRFAHRLHGLSYDDPEIAKRIAKLTIAGGILDATDMPDTPELRVLLTLSTLGSRIDLAAHGALNERRIAKG